MNFPYISITRFFNHQKSVCFLPWIRVGIANPKNPSFFIYFFGLVDSGSEMTIINREIGEGLNYEIENKKIIEISGVGGKIKGYVHKAILKISDGENREPIIYEDYIVFAKTSFPASMPEQTALLGLRGFFNHFIITFNHPQYMRVEQNTFVQ